VGICCSPLFPPYSGHLILIKKGVVVFFNDAQLLVLFFISFSA